jgi:hypothetical protein
MKYFLIITICLNLTSCNKKSVALETENSDLKLELLKLKKELNQTKNALIIPYDSLNEYVETATCGQNNISLNQESPFTTMLVLKKLPKELRIQWKITNGKASLVKKEFKNELTRNVNHKFSTVGEKEIYGDYLITFPNGSSKIFSWARFVKVKDI